MAESTGPIPRPLPAIQERVIRIAGAVVAMGCAVIVLTGPSFLAGPPDPRVLAFFRASLGFLLLLRVLRLWRGRTLLWIRGRSFVWDRYFNIDQVLGLWGVAAICLAIGLAPPITAVLCLLIELYVFRRSYTHSLEDTLFQVSIFTLIFLPADGSWAIDRHAWPVLIEPAAVVQLWWLAIALLMYSAGLEKLISPIWRRGLGVSFFLGLPHLIQPAFRFLRRYDVLCWIASWSTIFAELGLLLFLWLPDVRTPLALMLCVFAVSLFSIVDLSFIGQVTLVSLASLLLLDLTATASPAEVLFESPGALTAALSFAGLMTIAVTDPLPRGRLRSAIAGLAVWTTGLKPLPVFTDQQLYGIYLYRVIVDLSDGTSHAVMCTFREDGSSGPLQHWRPRVFLKMTYEVTDLLLLLARYPFERARSSRQFAAAEALVRCGLSELSAEMRARAVRVVLLVKAVCLRDMTAPGETKFDVLEWQPFGRWAVTAAGELQPVELFGSAPNVGVTARAPELDR